MLEYLKYHYESFLGCAERIVTITVKDGMLTRKVFRPKGYNPDQDEEAAPIVETSEFEGYLGILESFNIRKWKDMYFLPVLDGYSWELEYRYSDGEARTITGSNSEPLFFGEFISCLMSPDLGKAEDDWYSDDWFPVKD